MHDIAEFLAVVSVGSLIVGAFIHIFFAWGVYEYASRRQRSRQRVHFVSPMIWALATLFGGAFIATAYWAIHHSSLALASADDPSLTTAGAR